MCGLCRSCHDISALPDCSDLKDVDIMGRSQMVYSLGCCLLNDVDSILTRECTMHVRAGRQDPYCVLTCGQQQHRSQTHTGALPSQFPHVFPRFLSDARLTLSFLMPSADGGKNPVSTLCPELCSLSWAAGRLCV